MTLYLGVKDTCIIFPSEILKLAPKFELFDKDQLPPIPIIAFSEIDKLIEDVPVKVLLLPILTDPGPLTDGLTTCFNSTLFTIFQTF